MTATMPDAALTAAPAGAEGRGVHLRASLLEAGLLIETGTLGLYHRSGEFEDVLRAVEAYSAAQRQTKAPRRFFPPVLPRGDFIATDYLRSFPDLIGSIDIFTGGDVEHRRLLSTLDEGGDWTAELTPGEVVLSSSVCHSLYATLPRQIPQAGVLVECSGFAFRHEPSLEPTRMQSFRMYEFVLAGTPEQALAHRDLWADRALAALEGLQLPVTLEPANDPFFGRAGRMLKANQLATEAKYEVVCDLGDGLRAAIASSNLHDDHFGHPFDLRTPDGAVAHSACVGFGLERITLALFATHGLTTSGWPAGVRATLGLDAGSEDA